MDYEVVIIGAGMSGLAAGVRLAYFDKRVCILERHEVYGGLNSFYRLGGRDLDVGLHAVTNYVGPQVRAAPLPQLLRQLRLSRDAFDLRPQSFSEVRFGQRGLRFGNEGADLLDSVAAEFPGQAAGVARLMEDLRAVSFDDLNRGDESRMARRVLSEYVSNPVLVDMLLCPVMYYGSARPHDMLFDDFATLFKSIVLEGFARPPGGVRTILKVLVRQFRKLGGKLRTRAGVQRLETSGDRVTELVLDSGERLTAGAVLSCAGLVETRQLCGDLSPDEHRVAAGEVSFIESVCCLDTPPRELGIGATIIFANDSDRFTYAPPEGLIDLRSGVICCPNNFADHEGQEGMIRITRLAAPRLWAKLEGAEYEAAKQECHERSVEQAAQVVPDFRDRVVFTDIFTPRTIQRFTGRVNGAVYGVPNKVRDGRTRLKNLFICGTDQGFLGIIGAMLSGIGVANRHVLSSG